MPKRSLILYFSLTGNTEKVVQRFKQVFEKRGWECDLLKVTKKTPLMPSPFDCDKYDFICVGSGVYKSLPSETLIDAMRYNPRSIHYGPSVASGGAPLPQMPEPGQFKAPPEGGAPMFGHTKTILGPETKRGIVFVTYAGHEFGPPEAVPALETLALELEHLKIKCAGKFSCPGKFGKNPEGVWYKDIMERPNARDLLKAEIFLEEVLEELD